MTREAAFFAHLRDIALLMTATPLIRPLALAFAAVLAAPAAAAPCALAGKAEAVAPERALDGDTVLLDDGREVRLAGVEAPKPPLGAAAGSWPLADEARRALDGAVAGRVLELRVAARASDRYGRVIGFLSEIEAEDHTGVASVLLARGLARVSGEARDCGATLLAAESAARASRLGLWSEPYYEVRDAADGARLASDAGRFVVAEGRVASVRTSGGRTYVNFGARWRDALALSVSEAALRRLGGLDTLKIVRGARLRVRGVVEARLGPTIAVTDASQIERVDGAGRSDR